jgi:DNA-directed RNA polymerase beta' subunit
VQKLWRHQISMRHIVKCINNTIDLQNQVFFVWSHESIGIFDIWVYDNKPSLSSVMNLKEASKIAGNITEENKMQCYINKVLLAHILNVYLTGVKGLEECYYTNEKGTWRIDTKGGSLKDLFRLECVDGKRCRSNDMHEVSSIFGIEAVKQFLRDEFSSLIKVNPRHLELLIDSMTVSGSIQRVTRNGIDRKQVGTIAKASFEQPVDNFLISASTGERDPLKGVSASITVGKVSNIGTGFFDLFHDPNKHEIYSNESMADQKVDEEEMEIDIEEVDNNLQAQDEEIEY